MKRLSLSGLLLILAAGFLYFAFGKLISTAEAQEPKKTASPPALFDAKSIADPKVLRQRIESQRQGNGLAPMTQERQQKIQNGERARKSPHLDPSKAGEKCINTATEALVSLISNDHDRTVLKEQLAITVYKLSLETMQTDRRTVEELLTHKKGSVTAADVNKVRDRLTSAYQQFGRSEDLDIIAKKFSIGKYVNRKPDPQWSKRFGTNEISAYVQMRALDAEAAGAKRPQDYEEVDAAILWFQSHVTDRLEQHGVKVGCAERNLEEVSTQVAFLTGYIKNAPRASDIQSRIASSQRKIADSFVKAMSKFKEKIAQACPKEFAEMANCPDCLQNSPFREKVTTGAIAQVIDKMKANGEYTDKNFIKKTLAAVKKYEPSLAAEATPEAQAKRKWEQERCLGKKVDGKAVAGGKDSRPTAGDPASGDGLSRVSGAAAGSAVSAELSAPIPKEVQGQTPGKIDLGEPIRGVDRTTSGSKIDSGLIRGKDGQVNQPGTGDSADGDGTDPGRGKTDVDGNPLTPGKDVAPGKKSDKKGSEDEDVDPSKGKDGKGSSGKLDQKIDQKSVYPFYAVAENDLRKNGFTVHGGRSIPNSPCKLYFTQNGGKYFAAVVYGGPTPNGVYARVIQADQSFNILRNNPYVNLAEGQLRVTLPEGDWSEAIASMMPADQYNGEIVNHCGLRPSAQF